MFIQARESYLRALGRHRFAEEQLMNLLGAKDTDADLERAILEARTAGLHYQAISDYCRKSFELDKCTSDFEVAKRFVDFHTGTTAGIDADLQRLEC